MASVADLAAALDDLAKTHAAVIADLKAAHEAQLAAVKAQSDADANALTDAIAQIAKLKADLAAAVPVQQ